MYQLNLYRLITDPPPKKKPKKKRKIKNPDTNKTKKQREMQPCYMCKCTL